MYEKCGFYQIIQQFIQVSCNLSHSCKVFSFLVAYVKWANETRTLYSQM